MRSNSSIEDEPRAMSRVERGFGALPGAVPDYGFGGDGAPLNCARSFVAVVASPMRSAACIAPVSAPRRPGAAGGP